jgi:hypothetical protein
MSKVLVTVTFEYECDDLTISDMKDEMDIVEKTFESVRKGVNARTLVIHDIKGEIVE